MTKLPAHTETPDSVLFGKRRFPFTSFEEASKAFCHARDNAGGSASGETGPQMPDCVFLKRYFDEEYVVGFVSYNGKAWTCDVDISATHLHKCVYDPSAAQS
jgi:hypothetical protein